jgi:hypothetical protein
MMSYNNRPINLHVIEGLGVSVPAEIISGGMVELFLSLFSPIKSELSIKLKVAHNSTVQYGADRFGAAPEKGQGGHTTIPSG